jgi:hypothetical protein
MAAIRFADSCSGERVDPTCPYAGVGADPMTPTKAILLGLAAVFTLAQAALVWVALSPIRIVQKTTATTVEPDRAIAVQSGRWSTTPEAGATADRERDDAVAGLDRLASAMQVRLDEVEQVREEIRDQSAAVAKAKAAAGQAALERQVAELAVREYEDGLAGQESETAAAEVALAEGDDRAARRGEAQGADAGPNANPPRTPADDDASARLRARLALDLAKTKRDVVLPLTRARRGAELRRDVEKAKAEIRARSAALEQERADLARLERQLASAALSADETRALSRIDEATQLAARRDGGAKANLATIAADAARLWTLSQHRRDERKREETRLRIQALARDGKP